MAAKGILDIVNTVVNGVVSVVGISTNARNSHAGSYTSGNFNYSEENNSDQALAAIGIGFILIMIALYFLIKASKNG